MRIDKKLSKIIFILLFVSTAWAQLVAPVLSSPSLPLDSPSLPPRSPTVPPRSTAVQVQAKHPISNLRILVSHPEINPSLEKLDTIEILVRDNDTARVFQMTLQESAPASEIFSGNFTVNWTEHPDKLNLEILIPDQDTLRGENSHKRLEQALANKSILPKPFFYSNDNNVRTLNVFNSQEDADEAKKLNDLKATEATPKNNSLLPKEVRIPIETTKPKDALATSVLADQQMADIVADEKAASAEAQLRKADRAIRTDKAQATLTKLQQKFDALSADDKAKQSALAARFADAALKLYEKPDFPKAEKYFSRAFTLNPYDPTPLYPYGVTLFRNGKYNDSLIYLDLAQAPAAKKEEAEFYEALDLFRLKEYDASLEKFDGIRKRKVEKLGASAAFYEGLTHFQRAEYLTSKPYFEEVLETSKDPSLDRQAESYIEQIAKLEQYAETRSKKFIFNAYLGLQYDSNILLLSSSQLDQATPSNIGGVRSPGGMSLYYRPVFTPEWEGGFRARVDSIYTYNGALAYADPIVYNVAFPVIYKTNYESKPFRTEVRPAFELLYYDVNQTGTKIDYINSAMVNWNNTLVMEENWYTSVNLKLRNDSGIVDPNTNAFQYSLNWNNILFPENKKTKSWIADVTYTNNAATGTQYKYSRADLGLLYMTPTPFWKLTATGGVTYYLSQYSLFLPSARSDNDYALVFYLTRPILSWLNMTINGSYIINNSTDSNSSYKKFVLGTIFSTELQF